MTPVHDDNWTNDQPTGASLRWVVLVALIVGVLVAAILLTGCSGISQQEWDGLQDKHRATLSSLEQAEEERQIALDSLKRTRAALARARKALQRLRDFFRGVE